MCLRVLLNLLIEHPLCSLSSVIDKASRFTGISHTKIEDILSEFIQNRMVPPAKKRKAPSYGSGCM
jgi:hypothetical protein